MAAGISCLLSLAGCSGLGAPELSDKDRELAEVKAQSARRREALEEARRVAERLGESLRVLGAEKERLVSDLAKAETESALRAERLSFLERALRARDENVLALEGALENAARGLREVAELQGEALAALRGSTKATDSPDAAEDPEDDELSISARALRELHRALGNAEAKLARAARLTSRLEEQASGASPEAAAAGGDLATAEAISLPALASFERKTPSGAGAIGPRRPADGALGRPKPAGAREGFLSQLSEIVRRHFDRLFEPGRRWDGSDFGFLGAVLVALVAAFLVFSTPFRWMMRELRERELALLRRVVGAMGGAALERTPGEAPFPDVPAALEGTCPPDETQATSLEEIEEAKGEAPAAAASEDVAPEAEPRAESIREAETESEAESRTEELPVVPKALPAKAPPGAARAEAPSRAVVAAGLPPPKASGVAEEFTATQALPDRAEIADRLDRALPTAAPEREADPRVREALEFEATQEISIEPRRESTTSPEPATRTIPPLQPAEFEATQEISDAFDALAAGESPGATQPLARTPAERHPTQHVPDVYESAPKGPGARDAGGGKKGSNTQLIGYRDEGVVLHETGRPGPGDEVDLRATQVIPDVLLKEPAAPAAPAPPAASDVPGTEAIEEVGVRAKRTADAETRPATEPEGKRGSPAGPRRSPKDALASDKDLLAEIEALIGKRLGPSGR